MNFKAELDKALVQGQGEGFLLGLTATLAEMAEAVAPCESSTEILAALIQASDRMTATLEATFDKESQS